MQAEELEELFRVALGFEEQWEVVDTQLDVESRRRLDGESAIFAP